MTHTEPAFAKLNLTLDILGKREDGYHDMRMVMQSIDLHDVVTITPREKAGLTLTTDLPFLPKGDGNIASKAAARFFQSTGLPAPGLSIDIHKSIPVCAGMAGGSSDGAAVLRTLRRLCAPDMPPRRLEEIGALVGSDVPYCVRGGTALAEGRGERLTDLPPLPPASWWCASPPAPCPRRSSLVWCGPSACAATRTPPASSPPWSKGTWRRPPTASTTCLRTCCPAGTPRSLRSRARSWSGGPWPPP